MQNKNLAGFDGIDQSFDNAAKSAFMLDMQAVGEPFDDIQVKTDDVFGNPERVLLVTPDEFTDVIHAAVEDLGMIVLTTRSVENEDNVHFRNLRRKYELPHIENMLCLADTEDLFNVATEEDDEESAQVVVVTDNSDPYRADEATIALFLKPAKHRVRCVPRLKKTVSIPQNMLSFQEQKKRTPLSNRGKIYHA